MKKERCLYFFVFVLFLSFICFAEIANAVTYTVKKGDILGAIGLSHKVTAEEIRKENSDLIKNVNFIKPGWKLNIPVKKTEEEEEEGGDKGITQHHITDATELSTDLPLSTNQLMTRLGIKITDQETEEETSDISLGGSLAVRFNSDLKKNNNSEDVSGGHSKAILNLKYRPEKYNGRQRFTLSVAAEYHKSNLDKKGKFEASFEELNFYQAFNGKGFLDYIDFKLGKSFLPLGTIAGIRTPMDAINPRDTRFFIPDDDDQKIASWLLETSLERKQLTAKIFLKPWFDKDKFDYFGTDWAWFGHAKENLIQENLPQELKAFVDQLGVTESGGGAEWGFDLNFETDLSDFGLNFLHGYADAPAIKSFPIKNIEVKNLNQINPSDLFGTQIVPESIKAEYYAFNQAGFYWSSALFDNEFRGEIVYRDKEAFLTNRLTSTFSPILYAIVELSRDTSLGRLTGQISDKYIINHDKKILFNNQHNLQLGLEWRKDAVLSDFLSLSVKALLDERSYYLSPELEYKIGEAYNWPGFLATASFETRLDLLGGSQNSMIGSRKNNSQIFSQILVHF